MNNKDLAPQDRRPLMALGLMSGTSMDGIDIALVETDGRTVTRLGPARGYAYDGDARAAIRDAMQKAAEAAPTPDLPPQFDRLGRLIADRHAEAVERFLKEQDMTREAVDVVGFHGQTIRHAPELKLTWQAGSTQHLADRLNRPVVGGFRHADVAAGGEGAPLAPLYHAALMRSAAEGLAKPPAWPVAVLNIGGVANVTWIPEPADERSILAFDTGPGNALIDDWVRTHQAGMHDEDGKLAARGQADRPRIERWLSADFFGKPPPKSLDRDAFADCQVVDLSLEDGAATLTAFTAAAVAIARSHFPTPARRWYVCGGGRHNPSLMTALADVLNMPVEPVEALGWRGDSLEAEAFAFLAVRHVRDLPLSLPATTGVPAPMLGGRLYRP